MTTSKTRAGIIGCGKISGVYFSAGQKFEILEIAACADINSDAAKAKAAEFGIKKVCSVEQLLGDRDIEIVINLTIPQAHADVALAALNAGKHVYNEKPLTISREEGKQILALARERKLLVGCAPDTFLGAGIQTCRKLIDDGAIGEPVASSAFMMGHGHESWHPNPEFYYQAGGGPMFDMGPYYLTALINLIGPVRSVTGMNRITFPERLITSQPKAGQKIKVEVPTHVTGILQFANGAIGTIITSFDIWGHHCPRIEIYGTEGSLCVPDPNTFGGPVLIRKSQDKDWREIPLTHGYAGNSRGLGVADMVYAFRFGRAHRANGDLAYHVLDVMHAIHDSAKERGQVDIKSTCQKPSALPLGLAEGQLDE